AAPVAGRAAGRRRRSRERNRHRRRRAPAPAIGDGPPRMIEFSMRHAFADLALDVAFRADVRTLALFGDSGAGKTSALNAISGLLTPESGRIVLDDRVLFDSAAGIDVPVAERRVGCVFQDGRL